MVGAGLTSMTIARLAADAVAAVPAKRPGSGVQRMLAVMHARCSIGAAARQAALELEAIILTGSRPVLLLLGTLVMLRAPSFMRVSVTSCTSMVSVYPARHSTRKRAGRES